jgi:hypothetical protein
MQTKGRAIKGTLLHRVKTEFKYANALATAVGSHDWKSINDTTNRADSGRSSKVPDGVHTCDMCKAYFQSDNPGWVWIGATKEKGKDKQVSVTNLTQDLDKMGAISFKACDACHAWVKMPKQMKSSGLNIAYDPPDDDGWVAVTKQEDASAAGTSCTPHRAISRGNHGSGVVLDLDKIDPMFKALVIVSQKLCPVGNQLIAMAKRCEEDIHHFLLQEAHKHDDFHRLTVEFGRVKEQLQQFTQAVHGARFGAVFDSVPCYWDACRCWC